MKKGVFLMVVFVVQSQFCSEIKAQIGLSTKYRTPPQYFNIKTYSKGIKSLDVNSTTILKTNYAAQLKPKNLPTVFSVDGLPFFCKIEYKIGINQKLPVKFRLGDVQYVDELEGK